MLRLPQSNVTAAPLLLRMNRIASHRISSTAAIYAVMEERLS